MKVRKDQVISGPTKIEASRGLRTLVVIAAAAFRVAAVASGVAGADARILLIGLSRSILHLSQEVLVNRFVLSHTML